MGRAGRGPTWPRSRRSGWSDVWSPPNKPRRIGPAWRKQGHRARLSARSGHRSKGAGGGQPRPGLAATSGALCPDARQQGRPAVRRHGGRQGRGWRKGSDNSRAEAAGCFFGGVDQLHAKGLTSRGSAPFRQRRGRTSSSCADASLPRGGSAALAEPSAPAGSDDVWQRPTSRGRQSGGAPLPRRRQVAARRKQRAQRPAGGEAFRKHTGQERHSHAGHPNK